MSPSVASMFLKAANSREAQDSKEPRDHIGHTTKEQSAKEKAKERISKEKVKERTQKGSSRGHISRACPQSAVSGVIEEDWSEDWLDGLICRGQMVHGALLD